MLKSDKNPDNLIRLSGFFHIFARRISFLTEREPEVFKKTGN